jgi:polysaccharide pyruvyl transferase CsaB
MKLLINGYYGYGNLGDEAILSGLVSQLRDSHRITVLSGKPAETRRLHGVAAVPRYWAAPLALWQSEVLISGGGGLLQDKTSSRSLQYYLGLIDLAKKLRKRVIVYGQSIGPLSAAGRRAVAEVLKNVPIAVRDRASQQLLADLGLDAKLVADAALLLEAEPVLPSKTILLLPRHSYPDVTDALIQVARALLRKGIPVAASMVQPDEDSAELERLLKTVPEVLRWSASTPEELLGLIAKAAYVISARLHGLILAAAAGVNYSGIVYDPKVAAFLAETDAPIFELPVNHLALLRAALDRPEVPAEKVKAMKARAKEGIEWLDEQLSIRTQ